MDDDIGIARRHFQRCDEMFVSALIYTNTITRILLDSLWPGMPPD